MDKEAKKKIRGILQQRFNGICTNSDGVWTGYSLDHHTTDDFVRQIDDALEELGYARVICPECGHVRDEDRVRNGMKCSYCAGYGGK